MSTPNNSPGKVDLKVLINFAHDYIHQHTSLFLHLDVSFMSQCFIIADILGKRLVYSGLGFVK